MFLRDLKKWLNMIVVKIVNSKILTQKHVTKSNKPELNISRRFTIIRYMLIKIGAKVKLML
jgi:hypothetical protein